MRYLWIVSFVARTFQLLIPFDSNELCPIANKAGPNSTLNEVTLHTILKDSHFRDESARKLSGAVQIPTEIYDYWKSPQEEPSRYTFYQKFHEYLEETFSLVYSTLEVEVVNEYGLIFTWRGSEKLKPLMLTAHMDVVPVQKETTSQWTYPPFSGYFDGEYLWGRGSSDCKNLLVGLLESLELLIKDGFDPKRSLIVAFGFDEETSGTFGAAEIFKVLYSQYGQDSMYAIIDEGSSGLETFKGLTMALPSTGEKGYLDALVELTVPGGHSSVPPDHTGIGIMSEFVTELDSFQPVLTNKNPTLEFLQCIAMHSDEIEPQLRSDIMRANLDMESNRRVVEMLSSSKKTRFLVETSQAADIIQGGAKANALPEHVSLLVNYRIAIEQTVEQVSGVIEGKLKDMAQKYDTGLFVNGKELLSGNWGHFNLTHIDPLEPAPITPSNDKVWEAFAGALRYFYEEVVYDLQSPLVVAPGIMTGNTDTKSYWNLTRNIYRYSPGVVEKGDSKIHSVDEHVDFQAHLHIIAFFYEYVRLVDEIRD